MLSKNQSLLLSDFLPIISRGDKIKLRFQIEVQITRFKIWTRATPTLAIFIDGKNPLVVSLPSPHLKFKYNIYNQNCLR